MERLAGLGPSADTSAKRKKQVVCLLTPQQSERYLKEMSEKQFHYLQKNSEYVDWQHKNEYNWINPCCTFSFSTLSIIALELKRGKETHTVHVNSGLSLWSGTEDFSPLLRV